ncbi:MAG: futalosine hydrolase [Bacteroidetes bacterium GWC2_33_15]|nr:MAG: futalosine hydrolase [Bacteroidetes bacterium GWA2_33_15]OFX49196.1 MAG: futalosine hydrolase [Bacteroidetes bacterium GWC2_33_15]OFX64665.1 MAG: futalosine hydrolase [Bacteroidetes bacterium GWB2_32_14]OFX69127.1 MAG: futalosine hydrolase [Bacteroidetes bacterium GWD2_33_33]HAN17635.1 futalosine hydrolase [Bacteroidales bacterium]
MKILIVSATEKEILPFIHKLGINKKPDNKLYKGQFNNIFIDILITGIGSIFTTYSLTKHLVEFSYDYVINAGIAGSFNFEINIGDVILVQKDQFADLGIEDKQSFYTLFEKGFIAESEFPFKDSSLYNSSVFDFGFKTVSAITVNTTHGNSEKARLLKGKFNAEIETMEGAAFFYVCLMQKVKFIQLRSISNYVTERDQAQWNIPLAVNNLNDKLFDLLIVLREEHKN